MIIDENKFRKDVFDWEEEYKYLSPRVVMTLLAESEVKTERTICPRCQGVYDSRADRCPLCKYRRLK